MPRTIEEQGNAPVWQYIVSGCAIFLCMWLHLLVPATERRTPTTLSRSAYDYQWSYVIHSYECVLHVTSHGCQSHSQETPPSKGRAPTIVLADLIRTNDILLALVTGNEIPKRGTTH